MKRAKRKAFKVPRIFSMINLLVSSVAFMYLFSQDALNEYSIAGLIIMVCGPYYYAKIRR